MTKKELKILSEDFERRLKELHGERDIEGAHMCADEILCDLLESLEMYNVVDAFHKVPRWYS